MRKFTLPLFAATVAFAAPASAAVTVAPINGPNLSTQIHASSTNAINDTTVVYGSTASGGNSADVTFTGNTAIHITGGAGFAAISDVAGGGTFTQLVVDPQPFFNALQFSVQLVQDGFIFVDYLLAGSATWGTPTGTNPFAQSGNQLRDYQLTATGGDVLSAIRITSCASAISCNVGGGGNGVGIFLQKQNSITVTDRAGNPVPEPATWAMMLVGFGAAGYSLRRRRRATALQAA